MDWVRLAGAAILLLVVSFDAFLLLLVFYRSSHSLRIAAHRPLATALGAVAYLFPALSDDAVRLAYALERVHWLGLPKATNFPRGPRLARLM